jgi:hypothetical protein
VSPHDRNRRPNHQAELTLTQRIGKTLSLITKQVANLHLITEQPQSLPHQSYQSYRSY